MMASSHIKGRHGDHNGPLFFLAIGCVIGTETPRAGWDQSEGRGRPQGGDNSGIRWGGTKSSGYGYYISFSNKFSLFGCIWTATPLVVLYIRSSLVVRWV